MNDPTAAAPTAASIIGEARTYDELIWLFRKRCDQLGASMERLDDVAGLPQRYISKLLAPAPIKGIGRVSLGPMLGALGLVLVVNEDAQALAKIKHRLVPSAHAGTTMLAQKKNKRFLIFRGNPDLARKIRKRQVLMQSPRKRREIARNAALIRWRGVKGAGSAPAPRRNSGFQQARTAVVSETDCAGPRSR